MSIITDISVDNSGTVSAVIDGSKVQLDMHVLLMKVLANSRQRLTTQYLDEVNGMNRVNNKANMYRDLMEGLRQVKASKNAVHYEPDMLELNQKLREKYGEELFNELDFDINKYGGNHYHRVNHYLSDEEWNKVRVLLEKEGITYEKQTPDLNVPGAKHKAVWKNRFFNADLVSTVVEDLRHKITSMNNLNSQNQIKVKMIEQFRNETIEWQKSLLDKLDRLFQKVNQ